MVLEELFQDILQGEKIFLGRNLNGHVENISRDFEGVHEAWFNIKK